MCNYYPGQHYDYLEELERRNRHSFDACGERTLLIDKLKRALEEIGVGANRLRQAGAKAAASVAALL